jgi:hypothetical protein
VIDNLHKIVAPFHQQQPILPRRLYRFRALRNKHDLQREMASIQENYLYCASFSQMNDPMEGFFNPSKRLGRDSNYETTIRDQIVVGKTKLGIASFTETHDDVLMWAHYASSYSGLCFSYSGYELDKGLSDRVNLV